MRVGGSAGQPTLELGPGQSIGVSQRALEQFPRLADRVGDEVAVGMRPEHFMTADQAGENARWDGRTVTLVEMLGSEMHVHFETDVAPILSEDMREAIDDEDAFERLAAQQASGQVFVARFDPGNPPKVGDVIPVGFDLDHLHFFDPTSGRALR